MRGRAATLSGYEKSPDYGGLEPTLNGVALGVLAVIAVAIVVILFAAAWL